ncbi:MAG: MaoC family dehydratase N-terminal domain-containing protein [Chloroflexi bacterium]|nr:MaoC family dehydratase N-terminal domain-containing protein [Chloroflexota bacterium]
MVVIEDGIPIGQRFVSMGRTIGEGDFTLFHNLSWTIHPVHCDREYMRSSGALGAERVLGAPCTLAIAAGLALMSGVQRAFNAGGNRDVAWLGYEDVRFLAPVFPDDTLTLESEVLSVRATSKPQRRVARIKDVLRKQTGEVVMQCFRSHMFEKVA